MRFQSTRLRYISTKPKSTIKMRNKNAKPAPKLRSIQSKKLNCSPIALKMMDNSPRAINTKPSTAKYSLRMFFAAKINEIKPK